MFNFYTFKTLINSIFYLFDNHMLIICPCVINSLKYEFNIEPFKSFGTNCSAGVTILIFPHCD